MVERCIRTTVKRQQQPLRINKCIEQNIHMKTTNHRKETSSGMGKHQKTSINSNHNKQHTWINK